MSRDSRYLLRPEQMNQQRPAPMSWHHWLWPMIREGRASRARSRAGVRTLSTTRWRWNHFASVGHSALCDADLQV